METINSLSSRSLQYFVIAKKWSSDLDFYKFESGFLRSLLDSYYSMLANKDEKAGIKQLNNELLKLDTDKNQLEKLLGEQIIQLELMSEDVIPEDTAILISKQIQLEYCINKIFKDYRELKKSVFQLIQKSMSDNKTHNRFTFLN